MGHGRAKAYRHNDLGLVVDLGGKEAVAKPLGVGMSGIAAKAMTLLDDFYNVDVLGSDRIGEQAWQMSFNVAVGASAKGTLDCVEAWLTDFRADLPRIDVPALVVQGTEDRILPIESTGRRLPALIKDARYVEVEGGPHNIAWTYPKEVNHALLNFLAERYRPKPTGGMPWINISLA